MTEFNQMFGLFEHPVLLSILIALNWPLYRGLVGLVFGGLEEMGQALKFWVIPDFYSFLKHQYLEDQWAELKLSAWFLLCALCVMVEYSIISQFLEWWFENVVCCSPYGR